MLCAPLTAARSPCFSERDANASTDGPAGDDMDRREVLRERVKTMRLACAVSTVVLLSAPDIVRAQSAARDTAPGAAALAQAIPIFPLEDVMLFPNISRPLHIFEPRYRAMV